MAATQGLVESKGKCIDREQIVKKTFGNAKLFIGHYSLDN